MRRARIRVKVLFLARLRVVFIGLAPVWVWSSLDLGKSGFSDRSRILVKRTGHVQAIQVLYFNTTTTIAFDIIIFAINIVITIFITRQFCEAAALSTFCYDKIASGKGCKLKVHQ